MKENVKRKGYKGQKKAKTSQKPTRNERVKKKSEDGKQNQKPDQPTQQERQSKVKIMKPGTIYDKFLKFQRLFRSLEFKDQNCQKIKVLYKGEKGSKEPQGPMLSK
ncbi:hypothetical protein Tco_1349411 [Tanacetum coccineum]